MRWLNSTKPFFFPRFAVSRYITDECLSGGLTIHKEKRRFKTLMHLKDDDTPLALRHSKSFSSTSTPNFIHPY